MRDPSEKAAERHLRAEGLAKMARQPRAGSMRPGQDLVVAGYAGYAGAVRIVGLRREELLSQFSEAYLERITMDGSGIWNGTPDRWNALGVTDGEPAGEGGILTALWNLSGDHGMGIEFSLRLIPVRQSTIEICERYGLNPYRLYSEGCQLFAADHGGQLVRILECEGSCGAVIGRVIRGSSRIVDHGEHTGYLERPADDEINKIFRR